MSLVDDDLWTQAIEYAKISGKLEEIKEDIDILKEKMEAIKSRMYEIDSNVKEGE